MPMRVGAAALRPLVTLLGPHSALPFIRGQIWNFVGTVEPQQRLFVASYSVLSLNALNYLDNLEAWALALEYACDSRLVCAQDFDREEFGSWQRDVLDLPPHMWNEDECDW